jgi:Protein of unknown function (DUF3298)/WG containing repeat
MNQFSSNLLFDTFLPANREEDFKEQPYIIDLDIDGDQMDEIAIGYSYENQYYVMLLKAINRQLKMITHLMLKGKIHYFHAHRISSPKQKDLVIGVESEGKYELYLIGHSKGKYINLLTKEYYYDQLKIEDIDHDQLEELALWNQNQTVHVQTMRYYKGKLYPIDQSESSKPIVVDLRETVNLYEAKRNTIEGNLWGFINKQGDFIIEPQFEEARSFHNGRAVVRKNQLYGLINKLGEFVIQPLYQTMGDLKDNRLIVTDESGFHVLDETGKLLTKKPYSYINEYKDGRAKFYLDQDTRLLYGYLDMTGREIIPASYLEASDFNDGKAVVKLEDNKYALINGDGDLIELYDYFYVSEYGENKMAYRPNRESLYGYLNEKGEILIDPHYNMALPFKNETAIVNTSTSLVNQYGLIDGTGKWIIEPNYNEIIRLSDNRLAIGKARDKQKPYLGSHFAVATSEGEFLTPSIFDEISEFKQNLASAIYDDKTLLINHEGRVMKELPVFSGTGQVYIENELLKADIDYQTSYYDLLGRLIYQENQVIPLRQKKQIIINTYKPNKDYLVYYPQLAGFYDQRLEKEINNRIKQALQLKKVDKNEVLNYTYYSHFFVRLYQKDLLELSQEAYRYELGSAHGDETRVEFHLNLQTGEFYQLDDLFKEFNEAIIQLNRIIQNQIETDPHYQMLFPDGFKGITANQPFYVTENSLHLYFNPYEIAPYYVGFPSFEIAFNQMMNLIDQTGSFWQSFH